jgi:hypothetical protein
LESITSTLSSLSRFRVQDEHLVTDPLVKEEIKKSFDENRCFPFIPDPDIIAGIKKGDPVAMHREGLLAIKNKIFNDIAGNDKTIMNRFLSDTRLSSRIVAGLTYAHRALADREYPTLIGRRFVLIKERHDIPTIYHVSKETTVISHVGQGPEWGGDSIALPGIEYIRCSCLRTKKRGERFI